jgi:CRP/FNR family nitrogen fixation transcriptional regulator
MLHWRGEGSTASIIPFEAVARPPVRSLANAFDMMGACIRFERNSEIFGEGEPCEYLYKVVTGAVRICKVTSDGRRLISAFHLPGEVFGLEASDIHAFSAEAIRDSQVRVIQYKAFLKHAEPDAKMMQQLWAQTLRQLQRAQSHMVVLGRKNAQERVASFLLEMASRLSASGAVELPMSRQDIADYLGLTIETVSRTLTQLARDGLIAMPEARRIVLRNRGLLDEMNDIAA